MDEARTILAELNSGPVTLELENGEEYETELDDVDVDVAGVHARGTGQEGDEQYRITKPPHAEGEPTLERLSLPEGEWEELGDVAFVSQ